MRRRRRLRDRAAAALLLLAVTISTAAAGNGDEDFKTAVEAYLKKHSAAVTQDLKAFRQLYEKQAAETEALTQAVQALQKQIAALTQRCRKLEQANAALEKELADERRQRREGDQAVLDGVTEFVTDQAGADPTPAADETEVRVYQVRAGDTLSAIAKAFNTTVARIKAANRMEDDTIHPGTKLRIPINRGTP